MHYDGAVNLSATILSLCALLPCLPMQAQTDWPTTGATPGNSHYSTLSQINRFNVSRLKVAWKFETNESGGLETTPIVVDGVLYACTPSQKIIALDAAAGKLIWKFDSAIKSTRPSRGLALWMSEDKKDRRLFAGIANFLYALDPATGKPAKEFGHDGRIDLREGLGRDPEAQSIALTTPGVVYKDLIIVGSSTPETLPAPPATFVPSMSAPVFCVGPSIPSRIPANRVTRPGLPTPGRPPALPTTGLAWPSTLSAVSSTSLRVPRCQTSTEPPASATTSTPTRSSLSTLQPASVSGIFRASITISGTATSLPLPSFSP